MAGEADVDAGNWEDNEPVEMDTLVPHEVKKKADYEAEVDDKHYIL